MFCTRIFFRKAPQRRGRLALPLPMTQPAKHRKAPGIVWRLAPTIQPEKHRRAPGIVWRLAPHEQARKAPQSTEHCVATGPHEPARKARGVQEGGRGEHEGKREGTKTSYKPRWLSGLCVGLITQRPLGRNQVDFFSQSTAKHRAWDGDWHQHRKAQGLRRRLAPMTQPAKHRKAPQSTGHETATGPTTQPAKHRKASQSTGRETTVGPHDPASKAPQSTGHGTATGLHDQARKAPQSTGHETATGPHDPARKAPQSTGTQTQPAKHRKAKHPARDGAWPHDPILKTPFSLTADPGRKAPQSTGHETATRPTTKSAKHSLTAGSWEAFGEEGY